MGRHDSSYRLLFSHVRMICDLLRLILGEAWVSRLDLTSAENVPSSFTSRGRKKRESDVIWKFRRRFRLERSQSWEAVFIEVGRLRKHVGLDEPELRRAFAGWLREMIFPRLGMAPNEIPQGLTLEEFEPMLAERIDSWNEQQLQKGRQQGLQQGRQEGEAKALLRLLEKRFGPVDQVTRDRIAAADADILLEWIGRLATAESLGDVFSG